MTAIPYFVHHYLPRRLPYSLGFNRYGLQFNGTSQYVNVSASASLNVLNAISFEAAIYVHDLSSERAIFYYNHTYGPYLRIGTDGKIRLTMRFTDGTSDYLISTNTITTKRLYHIVGTYDSSSGEFNIYVNGELFASKTGAAKQLLADTDLYIATQYGASGRWFYGYMLLAREYGKVLSLDEVRHNHLNYHNPVRSGLVLWLPFEEGAGLTAYDKSGYGNDGALLPADDPPVWIETAKWEFRAETE